MASSLGVGRPHPCRERGLRGPQARWGGRRGGAPSPPARFPQLWCERVNPENKAALEAWVRETGIRLVQVNGQRKYGGPPPGTIVPARVCRPRPSPLGEGTPPTLHGGKPELGVTPPIQAVETYCRWPLPPTPQEEEPILKYTFSVPFLSPQSPNGANDPGCRRCTHFTEVCSYVPIWIPNPER